MHWRESNRGWHGKGSGELYSCLHTPKTKTASLKQCPVTGPEILGTNWNALGAHLNIRKQLFTKRVTYHRSCRVVVGSWAMEIFKSYQDTHSGHVTLFRWYSLTRWHPETRWLFNLSHSMILWFLKGNIKNNVKNCSLILLVPQLIMLSMI